ncbi:MAG: hypothetical protein ACRC9X_02140 [Bacteroidales bacterium]
MNWVVWLSRNKRIAVAALLVVVFVGIWLYFWIRESEKKNSMETMRAIPADAAFVLRFNNLNKLNKGLAAEAHLARLLKDEPALQKTAHNFSYVIDSMARKDEIVSDLLYQPLWISAHIFGNQLSYLFALKLPHKLYQSNVKQVVFHLTEKGYTVSEEPYDDEKIISFKSGEIELFHATIVRRVLVISSSRVLVEMSIRQAKAPASLADNEHFLAASRTAGVNVDANFYLNHAQLNRLLPIYVNSLSTRERNFFARLGSFTVLDAEMRANSLLVNGFLFNDNLANSYFSVLSKQRSQKLTILEMLPRNTDAALCYSISNPKQIVQRYEEFRERQQTNTAQRRTVLANLRKKINQDLVVFFTSLQPSEIAVAHLPASNVKDKDNRFIVVKSSNIDDASASMHKLIAQAAKAERKLERSFATTEKMGNGEPIVIYRNPAQGLFTALQGNLFAACNDRYFATVGDYIVYGASTVAIREFIFAALLRKTLHQSVVLSDYANTEANVLVYLSPSASNGLTPNLLNNSMRSALNKSPLIAVTQGIALQLRTMNDKVYCSAVLKIAPKVEDMSQSKGLQLNFETKLNAPALVAPWIVKNHNSGQKELVVQDAKNALYLIDNKGVILWRRQLEEPIVGQVQQIDYLKNKKLQLIFNTSTKLYVVDRLGRNVEQFPITLPSAATAGVAVFDYDGGRDYRYFVPCSNQKISAYQHDGKPLKGFEPNINIRNVTQPLEHIRIQGNDYILVVDEHKVHLLNRRGEERVKFKERIDIAPNTGVYAERGHKNQVVRLVTTNRSGKLVFIYFDGNVEYASISSKPDNQHYFYYLNQVPRNKYVVLNNKDLYVYESNLKQSFSYRFKRTPVSVPMAFRPLKEISAYAVYIEEEKKSYLFNDDGKVQNGFPLKTVTPLTVDNFYANSNSYNVIACDENSFLSCYAIAP